MATIYVISYLISENKNRILFVEMQIHVANIVSTYLHWHPVISSINCN